MIKVHQVEVKVHVKIESMEEKLNRKGSSSRKAQSAIRAAHPVIDAEGLAQAHITHSTTRKLRKLTQHRTNKSMKQIRTNEQIRRAMRRSFETTHRQKQNCSLNFFHTLHIVIEAPHPPRPRVYKILWMRHHNTAH